MDEQAPPDSDGDVPAPEAPVPPPVRSHPHAGETPGPASPRWSASDAVAGADWQAKVADLVENIVEGVHDKVVQPVIVVARALVYGLVAGVMGLVLCVLLAIAAVRLLTVYIPGNRVWVSDAIVGGIFTAVGVFLWSRRGAATKEV